MYICAICQDEVDKVTREPLGKNDRLVNVCRRCSTERPAPQRIERAAYSEPYESIGGLGKLIPKLKGEELEERKREAREAAAPVSSPAHRIPGAPLHRIARFVNGKPIPFETAQRKAMREPWYARSRYIGGDMRYWVWQEMPDLAAELPPRRAPRRAG